MSFSVRFTPKAKLAAGRLRPSYVSPSTQSLKILTDGANPVVIALSTSAPNCTADAENSGSFICTAALTVPEGNHVFTVTAYDASGATGNVLSTNSTGVVTVKASGVTTVSLALEGLVRAVALGFLTSNPPVGVPATIGVSVNVYDADADLIVGPAAYDNPVTLTTSDATDGALSKTTLASPADTAGLTLKYSGAKVAAITLSASATGLPAAAVANAVLTPGKAGTHVYVVAYSSVTTWNVDGTPALPTISVNSGNFLDGIAVDTAGKIYVVNNESGLPGTFGFAVVTYNPDGTRASPTIDVGSGATGVAVDKAGKIYVAEGGNVNTYDANGMQTTPTIRTSSQPAEGGGVAVDPQGKIYITGVGPNTYQDISVFNPDGSPTGRTITAGGNVRGIAIDAAGKIYVTNADSNSITTYKPDGTPTTPTIATCAYPTGVAVDNATGKISVACDGPDILGPPNGAGPASFTTYNADGSPAAPMVLLGDYAYVAGVAVH